jgi:hypothetical protein
MSDQAIDNAAFVHKIDEETQRTPLMNLLYAPNGNYDPATSELYAMKGRGLDLNTPKPASLDKDHDPRSAFTQIVSKGEPYLVRFAGRFLGARPRADEDLSKAVSFTNVSFGDQLHEDHGSDRFLMAGEKKTRDMIESLGKVGIDLNRKVGDEPASHGWAAAVIEAHAFAKDDAKANTKAKAFLGWLAEAGVDFRERNAQGQDAKDVVIAQAKSRAMTDSKETPGELSPADTKRLAFIDKVMSGALEQSKIATLSRAVRSVAEKKASEQVAPKSRKAVAEAR